MGREGRGRGRGGVWLIALLAVLLPVAVPAGAQDVPDYRDDRSDAAALVGSYYNAIARQEYVRAWSYFGEEKPVADYDSFAAGYEGTTDIDLVTGPVHSEGAAGSLFSTVPVAFSARGSDGKIRVFAGCYTTRLAQPGIQAPPFQPLHIETARLHEAAAPLAGSLPGTCD